MSHKHSRQQQNTPPAWFMAAWSEYLADRDGVDHEPYLGDDDDYTCPIAALESQDELECLASTKGDRAAARRAELTALLGGAA